MVQATGLMEEDEAHDGIVGHNRRESHKVLIVLVFGQDEDEPQGPRHVTNGILHMRANLAEGDVKVKC
ncbi:hypothetical protein VNO78_22419 [Psophocarpus tetragonolobus]|uniref:Uncharacterized protein n=1 Tax=Psophocarpus tetragonolobus TaxID=3891 RepID=A0AAN9S4U3_PSOTE